MSDDDQGALIEIALARMRRGAFDSALAVLSAAAELDRTDEQAWFLQADIHRREGRLEAAIGCLRRAMALAPDRADLVVALANALTEQGRFEEAVDVLRALADAMPQNAAAVFSYGYALHRAGQTARAIKVIDRALVLDPDSLVVRRSRGQVLLSMGQWAEGFRDFDCSDDSALIIAPPKSAARWDGSQMPGKRLLVLPDGGHGDIIWAARFLKAARERVGAVHLALPKALSDLLSRVAGVDRIEQEVPDTCELYCSILSLPHLLGVEDPKDYPPARLWWNGEDHASIDRLSRQSAGKLRVGILWSGNPDYAENNHRAAALADFLPLVELEDVQLFSLQKGQPAKELAQAQLGNLVIETTDCDFAETAAVLKALDLAIMTDTAVAHIAGSLGTPVWVLLDTCPYWYFGQHRTGSPWYPGMRLYRQNVPGDWQSVMKDLRKDLLEVIEARRLEN